MNSNTSSQSDPRASAGEAPAGLPAGAPAGPGGLPAGLEALAAAVAELAAAVAELAAGDPTQLGDALLAEQVVVLRRLTDQLDAVWLRRLAAVDARGAAGAEHGTQARSTTAWLRATCQMSPGAAAQRVRTARALHRGPLAGTAGALAAGEVSCAHAATLADATGDLPPTKVAEAEEVLVEAARRLDPSRLRRLTTTCATSSILRRPSSAPGRGWTGGGCGWRPPSTAWSPSTGCWTPKPARPPRPPWPHSHGRVAPTTTAPPRSGAPTPSGSWPAKPCRPAGCPKRAGCGPS
jgi:hypothetical protein